MGRSGLASSSVFGNASPGPWADSPWGRGNHSPAPLLGGNKSPNSQRAGDTTPRPAASLPGETTPPTAGWGHDPPTRHQGDQPPVIANQGNAPAASLPGGPTPG